MNNVAKKLFNRVLRKRRIRARVSGTVQRPRLSIFVSNRHISAQIVDDINQRTLAATTTQNTGVAGSMLEKAEWVGVDIAKKAKKAKITQVVFDRGGRKYHGRVAALADAARKEGLEF